MKREKEVQRTKLKLMLLVIALLSMTFGVHAQEDATDDISFSDMEVPTGTPDKKIMVQPRKLIDSHTAGLLPRANFDFELRIYPSGDRNVDGSGMAFSFAVGITDRLNLGGGYGGDGLIGRNGAKGDPYPSIFLKYRLFEESFIRPAIALGFDPTGFGGIENDSLNYKGFIYKSQGFFLAFSKNYLIFKRIQLGLHGSVNYSLEEHKIIKWPNVFIGFDLGFNEELALNFEYDMALNQKDPWSSDYANPLRGIMNVGLRWNVVPALYVELLAKDLMGVKLVDKNYNNRIGWSRELRLVYLASFNKRNR